MSDITKLTLSELIKNIKDKKISSFEITKAFVERSEKSKLLNSYITEDFKSALSKAKKFETSYRDILKDSFFREKLCLKKNILIH